MGRRDLPALAWPLADPSWQALAADASGWALLPRVQGPDPLTLSAVDVVFEWGGVLVLRLTWPGAPIGRWLRWPRQRFVVLRAATHPGLWALLRAHLARTRRTRWFGAH